MDPPRLKMAAAGGEPSGRLEGTTKTMWGERTLKFPRAPSTFSDVPKSPLFSFHAWFHPQIPRHTGSGSSSNFLLPYNMAAPCGLRLSGLRHLPGSRELKSLSIMKSLMEKPPLSGWARFGLKQGEKQHRKWIHGCRHLALRQRRASRWRRGRCRHFEFL